MEYSANLEFNEGPKRFYKVLNTCNMELGIIAEQLSEKLRNTVTKQSGFVKKRRKHLRGIKKGLTDIENLAIIFADGQKLIVLYHFVFMAQLKLLGKNLLESQKFLIQ